MNRFPFFKTAVALAALSFPILASADTRDVFPGTTTGVALDAGFISALGTLGVTPSINRPAVLNGTQAGFPVLGGELDLTTAAGEIFHTGGLTLTAGTTSVSLINFLIDTTGGTPVLTGAVIQTGALVGRVPLFNLQLPALTLPLAPMGGRNLLQIKGIGVTLTAQAAAALNAAFGVTAFTEGFVIGQATTTVAVSPGKM